MVCVNVRKCPVCGSDNIVVRYQVSRVVYVKRDLEGNLISEEPGLRGDEEFDVVLCGDCGEELEGLLQ